MLIFFKHLRFLILAQICFSPSSVNSSDLWKKLAKKERKKCAPPKVYLELLKGVCQLDPFRQLSYLPITKQWIFESLFVIPFKFQHSRLGLLCWVKLEFCEAQVRLLPGKSVYSQLNVAFIHMAVLDFWMIRNAWLEEVWAIILFHEFICWYCWNHLSERVS